MHPHFLVISETQTLVTVSRVLEPKQKKPPFFFLSCILNAKLHRLHLSYVTA